MIQFAWHIHHDVLLEPLIEPLEVRVAYIKAMKPAYEVELRLRLLKPVVGQLPVSVVEVAQAYKKAYWKWCKSRMAHKSSWYIEAYDKALKARQAYNKILKTYHIKINKLHAQECPDCAWNGKTLF